MNELTSSPHLDVHPSVVFHLGDRLISDDVQAIVELVKNSYDADASWARLVVDTNVVTKKPTSFFDGCRGMIVIEDDGTGMNRDEIIRGWLTIADSPKVQRRKAGQVTPLKRRTPLGEKGLGRLGVQRLGSVVELYTSKINIELLPRAGGGPPMVSEHPEGVSYHVGIDWREFGQHDRLSQVPVEFDEQTPPEAPKRGTRIVVSELRDLSDWNTSTVKELQRKLSQFFFPFGDNRPFEVYAVVNGETLDLVGLTDVVASAAQSRFSFSHAEGLLTVEGQYKISALAPGPRRPQHEHDAFQRFVAPDRGLAFFDFLMTRNAAKQSTGGEYQPETPWVMSMRAERKVDEFGETNLFGERFADPGPFTGEIHVFRLDDRGTIPALGEDVFDETSDMVKRHRGVRVFRDGFAIRPYGMDGDDWLKLGSAWTEGSSYYGIRPQNVIGYVSISADKNSQLVEKTDREGFSDNPASRNFYRLMQEVVDTVNRWNTTLRRGYSAFIKEKNEALADAAASASPDEIFERVHRVGAEATKLGQSVKTLEDAVTRTHEVSVSVVSAATQVEDKELARLGRELSELLALTRGQLQGIREHVQRAIGLDAAATVLQADAVRIRDQMQQFAELASLGLSAEAISHELWTISSNIVERTDRLLDFLRRKKISDPELITYTEYMRSAASALKKQLSHLDPGLRYVRERSDVFGILDFAQGTIDFYTDRFARSSIAILVDLPFRDFRVRMNRGKLTQVIDNLLLNSEYWLQHDLKRGRIERAEIHLASEPPGLRVWDTGCGVDPALDETVFEPFVTNKPKGTGRGLGLFIARQLLESSGCSLDLSIDRNRFGRRFAFDVNLDGVVNTDA